MKSLWHMKWFCIIATFLCGIVVMSSCSKEDYGNFSIKKNLNVSIEYLKEIYEGKPIQLDKYKEFDQKDQISISGIVISDASTNNLPEGWFIIQKEKSGIAFKLNDSNESLSFKVGDPILVNVHSGVLTEMNGNIIITGIKLSDIKESSEEITIEPNRINLKTLESNFDEYNETLVSIDSANIVSMLKSGETYNGSKALSDGSQDNPGNVYLSTLSGSKLANKEVTPLAKYTGIAMYGNAVNDTDISLNQIWLRNASDIDSISVMRMNSPIIITGFLVNPSGSDVPQVGDSRNYEATNVSFTFKGGQEYIQLMALQDIDFSQTPYSLVVGHYNKGPMVDGWASGGQISFKFDLTEGFAKAGTFFYVGEGQMVIAGYSDQGLSTDISNANWIRNLNPNVDGTTSTLAGDGFGSSTTGLLTNGEANATGLAVFDGTDVTASSVPEDAVFYGGSVGEAYQPPYGYKIPLQSDLYNATDPETGDPQPLFGQGTNTFSVSGANANQTFVQMGGIVSDGFWIVPRKLEATTKTLSGTSILSDIESGPGITVFRK